MRGRHADPSTGGRSQNESDVVVTGFEVEVEPMPPLPANLIPSHDLAFPPMVDHGYNSTALNQSASAIVGSGGSANTGPFTAPGSGTIIIAGAVGVRSFNQSR